MSDDAAEEAPTTPPRPRKGPLLAVLVAGAALCAAAAGWLALSGNDSPVMPSGGQECVEQTWSPTAPSPGAVTPDGVVVSSEVLNRLPSGSQLARVCYQR